MRNAETGFGSQTPTTKPSLNMIGSPESAPTLDDVIALSVRLTGRQPTEDELKQAKKIMEG